MIRALLSEAAAALAANRMRTMLATLGVVIGVAAVVTMLAVGNAVQASIQRSISTLGSNLLIVASGAPQSNGVRGASGATPTLTDADAAAIARLTFVSAAAPVLGTAGQVVYGGRNWNTRITGTTPDYHVVQNWSVVEGRPLSVADVRSASPVAVLGRTVADELFPNANPLGQRIQIKKRPFDVIGVLETKGQSLGGNNQDDAILVPLTAARQRLSRVDAAGKLPLIMVQGRDAASLDDAQTAIETTLRRLHRIAAGDDADFNVRNLTVVAQAATDTSKILSFMLAAIGSISLLVGGIGIMNIMLVSVTERTREIGLRKALGARSRTVLLQFVTESLAISIVGCLVGAILGSIAAYVISQTTPLPAVVTPQSLLIAVAVSGSIGVFFGWYPALKASRLNPIDALRVQ